MRREPQLLGLTIKEVLTFNYGFLKGTAKMPFGGGACTGEVSNLTAEPQIHVFSALGDAQLAIRPVGDGVTILGDHSDFENALQASTPIPLTNDAWFSMIMGAGVNMTVTLPPGAKIYFVQVD